MSNHLPTILVTGGAGYIGSHMLLKLIEAGYDPIVVDNLSTGFQYQALPVRYHVFDINDAQKWDAFFLENHIDLVMHFAASIQVNESVVNPEKYYYNNFQNTLVLLNQMKKHRVRHLIFSSTAAIFGEPNYVPVDEIHPKNPINAYGKSKWMCELALADYETAFNIRSVCLRYFNAAGADPLYRVGFHVKHYSHLIPTLLSVAAGEQKEFNIFGRDYPTKDGTCIRDYIHVMDICDAHLLAMEYLLSGGKSNQFNLGNGAGHSVAEVIEMVKKVTGQPIPVVHQKRRLGDPSHIIADATKIRMTLGWKPVYSELEMIIQHSWKWMLKCQVVV